MRRTLADDYGWKKHSFEIKKIVDGEEKEGCLRRLGVARLLAHDIDLTLNLALGERYKSETQKARVISEEIGERDSAREPFRNA